MLRSIFTAAMLALNAPPPVPADYQLCATIHNGPVRPTRHIGGAAPLADIA